MIQLPLDIGLSVREQIDNYRRKNNIPEPDEVKKIYNKQTEFMEDELKYVTSLRIDSEVLDYIDLFPNLKSINFEGVNEISNEELTDILNKYPNLESLKVINESCIQRIDLSNLNNLKELEIISNQNLRVVDGLDDKNLEKITFYNNELFGKKDTENFCKIIYDNAYNGSECNIDVLYMDDFLKYLKENNLKLEFVKDNISWSEELKYGAYSNQDSITYTTDQLKKAYDKARKIVKKYIRTGDSQEERFAILYEWMCENVKYDYDAIDKGYTNSKDGIARGRKNGTNGSVNALLYGECVCQGYTKTMEMLLRICGVRSYDTACIINDKKIPEISIDGKKAADHSDHSILKVNLGGRIYYSDVTWDAARFQKGEERKYFLLSKEDIEKNHKLVGEGGVFSARESVSKERMNELLSFAKKRIKESDKENTPSIFLSDYEKRYAMIAEKIEELMIVNSKTPLPNFEKDLRILLDARDEVKKDIEKFMSKEKEKHKKSIKEVEQLLGTEISDKKLVYDEELKAPRVVLKDKLELAKEEELNKQRLSELYYEGKIELKKYSNIGLELTHEYENLKKKAPNHKNNDLDAMLNSDALENNKGQSLK